MKKVKSRKGFTLIELVVTVAILSLVCGMGVGIFASVMRNYGTASSTEMEQEKATQIEDYLIKSARTAKKVIFIQKGDSDASKNSDGVETKKNIPSDQGTYVFSKGGSSEVEIYDYIQPKGETSMQEISTIKVSGVKKLEVTIKRQNIASKGKFVYLDYTIEMINGYTVKGSTVMNNFEDSETTGTVTKVENIETPFTVCQYDESSGSTATDKAILFSK